MGTTSNEMRHNLLQSTHCTSAAATLTHWHWFSFSRETRQLVLIVDPLRTRKFVNDTLIRYGHRLHLHMAHTILTCLGQNLLAPIYLIRWAAPRYKLSHTYSIQINSLKRRDMPALASKFIPAYISAHFSVLPQLASSSSYMIRSGTSTLPAESSIFLCQD